MLCPNKSSDFSLCWTYSDLHSDPDMLGEFLMPILKEGINDMLFQQDGVPLHFHMEATDFLNWKFPKKWVGMGGPIIWPTIHQTLHPLTFSFVDVWKMLYVCHHWQPVCQDCWQDLQWLQFPLTCLTCGQNLSTDTIFVGLLTVSVFLLFASHTLHLLVEYFCFPSPPATTKLSVSQTI
jgi:hypothetical protein